MTNRMTALSLALGTLLLAGALLAMAPAVVQGGGPVEAVNATHGLALKGYDPVAYFTMGAPVARLETHTHRWQGATYRFASPENRERFAAEPARYAPQYGGYCAYAMSLNLIADVDPDRWAIVGGKLYLNKNRLAHSLWSVDRPAHIAAADQNWAVYPKAPVAP